MNANFGFAIVAVALSQAACSKDAPSAPVPAKAEPAPPTPAPPSPLDKINATSTLEDAIRIAKPLMSDTVDEMSPGAILLAAWSAKNMKWDELQKLPPTKYALVMKDSDEERGKLMCVRARVVEIHAEKTDMGKFYHGGMIAGYTNVYRFTAVGSTGTIVGRSWAGLCGVVIGKQSYHNSAGGMAHAVFLVGMFNLPENKTR